VEAIIRLLSSTEMSFIFCLVPHQLAGRFLHQIMSYLAEIPAVSQQCRQFSILTGLCELFRRSPGRNLNQKLLRDQVSTDIPYS
jgi:hypothetical protein